MTVMRKLPPIQTGPVEGLTPKPKSGLSRRSLLNGLTGLPATSLLTTGGLGLLAGCNPLLSGATSGPALYRLTPKSRFSKEIPTVNWQLIIETPLAQSGLSSTRIALQREPTRLEYYANISWTDRMPQMVLSLMLESFENTKKILAVSREAVGLRADFILKTEVREFQALYYRGDLPQTMVSLNAKLVKMPERTIVGGNSFEAVSTADVNEIPAIIDAFDEALGKVLKRVVEWTLITGNAHRDQA